MAYLHENNNPTIYDNAYQVIEIGPTLNAIGSKEMSVNEMYISSKFSMYLIIRNRKYI